MFSFLISVLAELKENYDNLQKKFAAAENTIDKLRFGDAPNAEQDEDTIDAHDLSKDESWGKFDLSTLHNMLIEIQNQVSLFRFSRDFFSIRLFV